VNKRKAQQPVVIIGAGPVGLSLAIELGMRSIDCIVIERNDRVGLAPRAKTTNVRTRTHLRRWGIADRLAEASPFGVDYPSDVFFVTRLGGRLLTRIPNASNCAPAPNPLYPEHGQWIPQYKLEEVLRAHAETLPSVQLRFGTEFVTASQDDEGVTVRTRIPVNGEEAEIRCAHLVGADGARSAVRGLIGAGMRGASGISRNYNIVFRAPGLAEAHRHGPGIMYWQVDQALPSLIGPMDRDDIWFFMPTRLPKGFTISDDQAAALIRDATGIDLPYEILSRDEWVASRLIADRYRAGRIFLAGDACHLHPPFGGFGMNMGVSDAVDLGWKLAATLEGWGGPALLESYEIERRPIHEQVMDAAVANHSVLSNDLWHDGLEEEGPAGDLIRREMGRRIAEIKAGEFHTLGTVLGYCYRASPVIAVEPDAVPPSTGQDYRPSSQPGCLAPHFWMADGRSIYDRFGPGLTLIARPDAALDDIARLKAEAGGRGIPLEIIEAPADDPAGLYGARFTLVRPDQHVGWRGDMIPESIAAKLAGWIVPEDTPDL